MTLSTKTNATTSVTSLARNNPYSIKYSKNSLLAVLLC